MICILVDVDGVFEKFGLVFVVLEDLIGFICEVFVIVVCDIDGICISYDLICNYYENYILKILMVFVGVLVDMGESVWWMVE